MGLPIFENGRKKEIQHKVHFQIMVSHSQSRYVLLRYRKVASTNASRLVTRLVFNVLSNNNKILKVKMTKENTVPTY